PQIAGQIAAREFGLVEAIVQDRPEHAIGKAVVVFLVILGAETGHHIVDVVVMDGRRLGFRALAGDLAAPAKPDALAMAHRRLHADFKPAGASIGLAVGYRDAIGNDN